MIIPLEGAIIQPPKTNRDDRAFFAKTKQTWEIGVSGFVILPSSRSQDWHVRPIWGEFKGFVILPSSYLLRCGAAQLCHARSSFVRLYMYLYCFEVSVFVRMCIRVFLFSVIIPPSS